MASTALTAPAGDLVPQLEAHRAELTGYCYRMLGSAAEAEDAVQETLTRAWRHADRFEGRSSLRSWLYRIATNACYAALDGRRRRALPMDLGPASSGSEHVPATLPEATWIEPIPTEAVLPTGGPGGPGDLDPAERAVARESIRLAFVAALQYLPPRQRAVLILREVLRWRAAEVAELLDTSVVSVNSALQRARDTLAAKGASLDATPRLDPPDQGLLARYVDAFERYDIERLVTLLHEDATLQMPPIAMWLRGRTEIGRAALADPTTPCRGSRLVAVSANGTAAFGQYRPGGPGGGYVAWALQTLEVTGGRITAMASFLDTAAVFPRFGLPLELPPG
jgi:RNA polymerase sigma-70 factor (ECF subfamily)